MMPRGCKEVTTPDKEAVSTDSLQSVIVEELSNVTAELKDFRQDVNKDIGKMDARLTGIRDKIR